MPRVSAAAFEAISDVAERRARTRQRMVLRVGIIDDGGRPSFCLVRNISPVGVEVQLFGQLARAPEVRLRVGDEDPLPGRVMWVREQMAGIRFNSMLEPERMLRITQKLAPTRRRSTPRVSASARAILRTGGRRYSAELCDISTSGAKVRTERMVTLGPSVILTLPDMPTIKSYVKWVADLEAGLVFDAPLPIQIIAGWLDERVNVATS